MKRRILLVIAFAFLDSVLLFPAPCNQAPQALDPEAGLMFIEPVTISFHYGGFFSRLQLTSSEARIWYSFHPADSDPAGKPLLVFFNGGPGSSSSCGLMSMYTSRYTLDNRIDAGGGDAFQLNPFSWTRLGNLLYIDARQAGFSYNTMDQSNDESLRLREFNAQNFNPFFDGAEFIRVLLRFLARHSELQQNPVVIVGESYGGVRATVMLHMLLNYDDYGNGLEMYQDPSLRDEIQEHYDVVFPDRAGTVVPPEVVVRQFRGQVLIQPALSMGYQDLVADSLLRQPGSLVYRLGQEVGIPYDPAVHGDPWTFVEEVAGRDLYIYTKPRGWLNGFFRNAGRLLRFVSQLSMMVGMDVRSIDELYASARGRAYKVITTDYPDNLLSGPPDPPPLVRRLFLEPAIAEGPDATIEPGDISTVFGALQPWDRYFLSTNGHANWAFHVSNVALVRGYEVSFFMPRFGRMFLQNVAHVPTFITNAALDLVIYSEATTPALAMHDDILESATHVRDRLNGEARPGRIQLRYRPGAFPEIPGLEKRTIRFPIYASSCHAVSLTQPEELLADVSTWLEEQGIGRPIQRGGRHE